MICIVRMLMKCTVRFLQNGYMKVHELKDTQKGVELMCHEMEKIYSEGMESGEKRGELKKAKETALSLAEMGLPVEKIAKAVNHNVNEVQKWIDENLCAIK